jgi:hypothetical protein
MANLGTSMLSAGGRWSPRLDELRPQFAEECFDVREAPH